MTDFHHIPERQLEIHDRLENWRRWVTPRPQAWKSQPMFRQYRSHAWQWHLPDIRIEIDSLQAHETERAIAFLPEKHRFIVRWAYVYSFVPVGKIQREAGMTRDAMAIALVDARDMLKNRLSKVLANSE